MATKRICFKQIYFQNPKVESNSDCFRVTVTVPLLDHLMSDLEIRFPENELTAYRGLHIIPYVMFATQTHEKRNFLFLSTSTLKICHHSIALIQNWIYGSLFGKR